MPCDLPLPVEVRHSTRGGKGRGQCSELGSNRIADRRIGDPSRPKVRLLEPAVVGIDFTRLRPGPRLLESLAVEPAGRLWGVQESPQAIVQLLFFFRLGQRVLVAL